jgi:AbrB family looped-hinge helix DNA binding protein
MNARAKMSSDGQIVVPKAIRDAHGWGEGTELEWINEGGGVMIVRVGAVEPGGAKMTWDQFEKLRVKVDAFPTDDEIGQTMLDEAARRFDAKTGR